MIMNSLARKINGISLKFLFSTKSPVKWFFTGNGLGKPGGNLLKWMQLVELRAAGSDCDDHHGNKYTGTDPGLQLRYASHKRAQTPLGPKLEIRQTGAGLAVTSHLQFIGKLPAFRSWTTVENIGSQAVLLEYVSSVAMAGISRGECIPWDRKMLLHVADNNWCGEYQWRSGALRDFGLSCTYPEAQGAGFGTSRVSISSQGTWSTEGHLPLGALENKESGQTVFWQIEHNGSWHWEVSDLAHELCLRISGPTYRESLWSKSLEPKRCFTSVPATFGLVKGGLQEALRALTQARRIMRTPHPDMAALPVIFNDYMNCLAGDPTTEKLLPVIDRAAQAGCEYFVIDAGWYAELGETWWTSVGEWLPSKSRFRNGLPEVLDYIRSKGMVPGLWLEIEVMGVNCPLATKVPDAWFFQRNGKRLIDHGRYQLDFRNPEVRAHADAVVDRMVCDYGVGYIKMDYNCNAGPGTDFHADASGDGLLEHNRAYLDWLRGVFQRHPGLVIENCASGGMRADYAQLSLHSMQSTSDQTDYRLNAVIAAASASAITPEQAAVWSYPLKDGNEEETILNMVNALLLRIHQSGRIHEISDRRFGFIKEGIALYKSIRGDIRRGLPFWPLGLPRLGDGWAAFGLDAGNASYLAVWRLDSKEKSRTIVIPQWRGKKVSVECIYPQSRPVPMRWSVSKGLLEVEFAKKNSARIFRLQ